LQTNPYRVVVTENGRLVRQLDFGSSADAQRVYDQERKAAASA